MSNNSFVDSDGLEMGRAQVVQAEACGIAPKSAMNPILLKPNTDQQAQLVLHGKPVGNQSAMEYFSGKNRDHLFREVLSAFETLKKDFSPIVIEGAGSISEMNLWDKDITNMRLAKEVQANTILVCDIDRGGIFGSVYGTLALLPEDEKKCIKGIIVNKFRGDYRLFADGKKLLEKITGVPVLGVIPYFRDIFLDQEDAVVIENKPEMLPTEGKIKVVVLLLPRMSNFTDFNALEHHPSFHVEYSCNATSIKLADIVIIPGTKNTISDLQFLREHGLVPDLAEHVNANKLLIGICGGYQMLGEEIHDPHCVEGNLSSIPGLGFFPMVTRMTSEKKTVQTSFWFLDQESECTGYEIHMGTSSFRKPIPSLNQVHGAPEGGYSENIWGTYMHGFFDNAAVLQYLEKKFKRPPSTPYQPEQFKAEQYQKLGAHFRAHMDMALFKKIMLTKRPS